ncbi:MAG: hypothetical protein CVT95_06970 [Bacteroidetes bacterium HGW-Bacteroidetes-12]|nr:MAG: hypothetical protein CVT95_06970 [Bacteroidetes bacterium HGW-Bacteroidetes-12]
MNKKKLVIHIGNLKALPKNLEDADLLDISSSIITENKLNPHAFFDYATIYPQTLNTYKQFTEKLLEVEGLLDLKTNDFPLYWISTCAIKYHSRHWAKDFFVLLTVLEQCKEKITEHYGKLTMLLPSHLSFLTPTIANLLKQKNYTLEHAIVFDNVPFYVPSKLAIAKAFFKDSLKLLSFKPNNKTVSNAIYFHSPGKAANKNAFLTNTQQLFTSNNKFLSVLPFYWNTPEKTTIPSRFLIQKPTMRQLFSLGWQVLKTYNQLTKLTPPTLMLGAKYSISTAFLVPELKQTLRRNLHLLIFHQWLTNYFSTLQQPTAIFFEDEFYEIGRIISAAAKKYPLVTTYGIQHGHFIEMHTVYSIYSSEINKKIPIPTHFITWGKTYNQLFLSNNNLPTAYTLALGNPNYVGNKLLATLPTKITSLLWCLTTKECMYLEWDILKTALAQGNYNLTIRLHPLRHITENEVTHLLGNFPFTFAHEQNITESFKNNDLIISSAHSTTFLDALVEGKFCIRITSRFWNGNLTMDNDYLRTVKNKQEFNNAMQFFTSTNLVAHADNNLLELKEEKWKVFIEELDA